MLRRLLLLLVGLGIVALAVADQVELSDGSIVKGKITNVSGGKLTIETKFVGTVALDLAHVVTFATDEPVNVTVGASPAVLGRVEAATDGVRLQGAPARPVASPADVTALWRQGAESPGEKIAREHSELAKRKWAYEATVAITGRAGTSDKFNSTIGGKATLASNHDRLIIAASTERVKDNGQETSDRQFGGVDYSWFYSPDHGWYMRTSLESDQIKALDLRSASAIGMTRKVVRLSNEELELRFGGSYTYEAYSNNDPTFESPGLDFTLLNSFTRGGAKLNTVVAYLPTFRDTGNYRIRHESNLEIPLTVSLWKLKVGISNEYQNEPPAGVDRFDTIYFTSLLLNWK
jgi:hypothetical protein